MTTSRVKFVETRSDVLNVVEIDAPLGGSGKTTDFSWPTVFGRRAHITSSEFRVEGNRLVQRVHLGEFDGESASSPGPLPRRRSGPFVQ